MTGCLKYCSNSVREEMPGVLLEVDSAACLSKLSQTGFEDEVDSELGCVCSPSFAGGRGGGISAEASLIICLVILSAEDENGIF